MSRAPCRRIGTRVGKLAESDDGHVRKPNASGDVGQYQTSARRFHGRAERPRRSAAAIRSEARAEARAAPPPQRERRRTRRRTPEPVGTATATREPGSTPSARSPPGDGPRALDDLTVGDGNRSSDRSRNRTPSPRCRRPLQAGEECCGLAHGLGKTALQEIDDVAYAFDARLVSVSERDAEAVLELDDESELLNRVELQIAEKVGVLGEATILSSSAKTFRTPSTMALRSIDELIGRPSARSSQRIRVRSIQRFRRLKPIAVR